MSNEADSEQVHVHADVDMDARVAFAHGDSDSDSDRDGAPEPAEDLMVVSRARRSNAGNRMSTLLAKAAGEDEEWGEEWEEAPNEEEFVGDDGNDHEDYNMDSSSSSDEDEGGDDDAGEKELRRAERQERIKKRKTASNPFAARLAAAAQKRVKLDVPSTESQSTPSPRPKKKSERASWIPLPEDGPTRTSSRWQTMANKEHTLAKLKEKDKKRDDTLAMMKAAEARKAKDEPKALTQAERLTEAARTERVNSKSLHRWEEAEEQRAAERQAKLDALKNRQIDGPFIRFYSGPAIWVDDKLKYTGKEAPKIEDLDEKLNKDVLIADSHISNNTTIDLSMTDADPQAASPTTTKAAQNPVQTTSPQHPHPSSASQERPASSHDTAYPSSIMFVPPQNPDSFLSGIEQYASQAPTQGVQTETTAQSPLQSAEAPFSQTTPHQLPALPAFSQPQLPHPDSTASHQDAQDLLAAFQKAPPPPKPLTRKIIRRALRNLLVLNSFPSLDAPHVSTRTRTPASLLKEKDRATLINLSCTLFRWSIPDATAFVSQMLNAPKTKKMERELGIQRQKKEPCAVTNQVARYRDPGTGIAYRDARAFGVIRGVVGGGFVWCGDLGCYVGGRGRSETGKSTVLPVKGVPKRFLEMEQKPAEVAPSDMVAEGQGTASSGQMAAQSVVVDDDDDDVIIVKAETVKTS
ncbi:YL1-domain-containing protein [Polyplosphaeria fusca]|uniref:YL1-domain-containing protein n=1 Tax=Polyplosphaeria fusca TaxID=682080 RepID=A0A9P4QT98_9PLEO|nr:YL1-domain-containing protein [Polyplosphaeria fusca]